MKTNFELNFVRQFCPISLFLISIFKASRCHLTYLLKVHLFIKKNKKIFSLIYYFFLSQFASHVRLSKNTFDTLENIFKFWCLNSFVFPFVMIYETFLFYWIVLMSWDFRYICGTHKTTLENLDTHYNKLECVLLFERHIFSMKLNDKLLFILDEWVLRNVNNWSCNQMKYVFKPMCERYVLM